MTLEDFENQLENNKEINILQKQIIELLELFVDLSGLEEVSYYKYNYEYNDFFFKFTVDKDGNKTKKEFEKEKTTEISLEKDKIIYGYLEFEGELKSSPIIDKLFEKIKNLLKDQKELERKILGADVSFNIYLFHDEHLDGFSSNLKDGLEGLFNVDVISDTNVLKHLKALKSKDMKHVVIFLIDDKRMIEQNEEIIKILNELIIIIGPNEHALSMYCGKLGIQNYIPISSMNPENIKQIIVDTRNSVINKSKFGNKMIALSGISGGLGVTSIAMNASSLLAQNLPNKNVLYIDLSTTKAVSNLFLEKNPLPSKTIIDLINTSEFHLENNLENGLVKVKENFYAITGIQKHIDKELLEKDIFIEKLLEYISSCSEYFNFIIIDLGEADASNLKSTMYDIVNEIWLITEMNLPHISKVKTFYSLMKRAGLKDKISFIVNRYDSQNAISVNDVTSILNMSDGEKFQFDDFKIQNDYKTLGKCWNYCELAAANEKNSVFIRNLESILNKKAFYKKGEANSSTSFFSSLFKKSSK